jgi:hypothetical protein
LVFLVLRKRGGATYSNGKQNEADTADHWR